MPQSCAVVYIILAASELPLLSLHCSKSKHVLLWRYKPSLVPETLGIAGINNMHT